MTDPKTARSVLERALAEWRKRETLNKQKTSLPFFAKYLGYSRPAVSLWLNGDKDISEDALLHMLPKIASLLGLEIYDELEIERPNLLLEYANRHWNNVPLKEQQKIAALISKHTDEPLPNDTQETKSARI